MHWNPQENLHRLLMEVVVEVVEAFDIMTTNKGTAPERVPVQDVRPVGC